MKNCIRHGDVFLKPIEALPEIPEWQQKSTTVQKRNSKIILTGEVTGHAHRMTEGEYSIIDYYEKTWRSEQPILTKSYLEVKQDSIVTHEEHGPLPVPPGLYEIIRAREFDYASPLRSGRWVQD
jgi:hypothetical protein